MRYLVFVAVFVLLTSCKQDKVKQSINETKSEVKTNVINEPVESALLIKKVNACDYLDKKVIARIFSWDEEDSYEDLYMDLGEKDMSICFYGYLNEKVLIRTSWRTEKARKNKVLEKNFKSYLSVDDPNIKYEKIGDELNTETIYGLILDNQGIYKETLRKRYGNTMDIIIEFQSPKDTKGIHKSSLIDLLERIDKMKM